MMGNGTATFANPDDYQAGIEDASVNLIVTGGGDFNARLTWLSLRRFHVLRATENLPRIAFVSLSPSQVFVSFPTSDSSSLTYSRVRLRLGDVVFHSHGERTHQRTDGVSQWGLIALPPEQLAACSKALTGSEITAPSIGRVLRPSLSAAARLLRLHSRACRLAERSHTLIANPEVARALEQELLHALVNCLTAAETDDRPKKRQYHADIMVRFEDALTAHRGSRLNMKALCAKVGVPERALRVCCTEFLGMGPSRYRLLRQLNMVRSALQRADPATATVADIARNHQFLELGRFAVTYRTIFGEMPSSTLRHSPVKTP